MLLCCTLQLLVRGGSALIIINHNNNNNIIMSCCPDHSDQSRNFRTGKEMDNKRISTERICEQVYSDFHFTTGQKIVIFLRRNFMFYTFTWSCTDDRPTFRVLYIIIVCVRYSYFELVHVGVTNSQGGGRFPTLRQGPNQDFFFFLVAHYGVLSIIW